MDRKFPVDHAIKEETLLLCQTVGIFQSSTERRLGSSHQRLPALPCPGESLRSSPHLVFLLPLRPLSNAHHSFSSLTVQDGAMVRSATTPFFCGYSISSLETRRSSPSFHASW